MNILKFCSIQNQALFDILNNIIEKSEINDEQTIKSKDMDLPLLNNLIETCNLIANNITQTTANLKPEDMKDIEEDIEKSEKEAIKLCTNFIAMRFFLECSYRYMIKREHDTKNLHKQESEKIIFNADEKIYEFLHEMQDDYINFKKNDENSISLVFAIHNHDSFPVYTPNEQCIAITVCKDEINIQQQDNMEIKEEIAN